MNDTDLHLSKDQSIVELVFPDRLPEIQDLLALYPPRQLPRDAMVTRFGPSPTGHVHLGSIHTAMISARFARQTGGVFILRIEDTDQKRKVPGAEQSLYRALEEFGLLPDEGCIHDAEQGDYGPYRQSQRRHIYQAFLKRWLIEGKAYPCFSTEAELEEMNRLQKEMKVEPGYYGVWAKWRDADPELVRQRLADGDPFVLRFRSEGNRARQIIVHDLIKGETAQPENDLDIVLMKGDGLPTYHFAHVIDDHLMGTTHVLRADEWMNSITLHLQLFAAAGFPPPAYGHLAPINKLDGDAKRKLSKRKDPEATVEYYAKKGYPRDAVLEYLTNLANSDFEPWRRKHPDKPFTDLPLTLARLANSTGPLFDETKLADIAKDVIARMNADEVYRHVLDWSQQQDAALHRLVATEPERWKQIFAIDRIGKGRKDIACWSMVFDYYRYFDAAAFSTPDLALLTTVLTVAERRELCRLMQGATLSSADAEQFMLQAKAHAPAFHLAESIKELKSAPDKFRGHVGEIMQVVRFAITGREKSPELFAIIQALGREEAASRLARQCV